MRIVENPVVVRVLALSALCVTGAASPAAAGTLYVAESGVSPYTEIQDAIDDAWDGDTIAVFEGTYGPVDFGGKDLRVVSTGGPSLTFIDAGGSGPAVSFGPLEPPTTLLAGFTITGGVGVLDDSALEVVGGGVVVRRNSEARVAGNVITGNSAAIGGGIGVVNASPQIYGNTIDGNLATIQGGGLWIDAAVGVTGATVFSCNQVRGNEGAEVGGAFVGDAVVHATNNRFVGNVGERGGLWLQSAAEGTWHNNDFVGNVGDAGAAGGVEDNSTTIDFVNNNLAFNAPGWGVVRDAGTGVWAYNNVYNNADGEYGGTAGNLAGVDGNVEFAPLFALFTSGDPYDDDLTLLEGSFLIDAGDPDAAFEDLDGSPADIGAGGGPHQDCDLDGDGFRVTDTPPDCRPLEGDFFPGAYEQPDALDRDCDGWGTLQLVNLVGSGGPVTAVGSLWEYGTPTAVPGLGWLSHTVWCTDCDANAPGGSEGSLELGADLSGVTTAGTAARLKLVHAYDAVEDADGGLVEWYDAAGPGWSALQPDAGYPEVLVAGSAAGNPLLGAAPLGVWSGDSGGWVIDGLPLDDHIGGPVDLRVRYGSATASSAPGWAIGAFAVQVEDADGDGRGADVADCDDTDVLTYPGAPEIPYDGIDQDCDGLDLVDVDGDGFVGVDGGGDDCDDEDPHSHPGGTEVPYDGQDQDCQDGDLVDVDGDGWASDIVGGEDCDDDDPDLSPDGIEVPYDGIDQDCNGEDLADVDNDGWDRGGPPFGDCDDNDPAINPGLTELCRDAIDNNCDGLVDELLDLDGDGQDECAGDCDETNPDVYAGAEEVCDGFDTDCDGVIDPTEVDLDGDGMRVCDGDCADNDPSAAPGFPEVCDGVDNDCDLRVDEDHDRDNDGFSSCMSDCDDRRSDVYPGAALVCEDGLDHDCDGTIDLEDPRCPLPEPGGCAASYAPSGAPAPAALLLLLAGALRRRRDQRSLRTQAAPGSDSPASTGPGASPSSGTQAR